MSRWGPFRAAATPDWRWYLAALVASPLAAGLAVAQPWILREVLDQGIAAGDRGRLATFATLFLVSGVLSFLFEATYTVTLAVGASRTIARLRGQVFAHLVSLGASFHDKEPSGRLLSRVTSDVEALGETLNAGAVTLVLDAMLVLGLLGSLLWMNWHLSLVLLLVAPPLAVVVEICRRQLRTVFTLTRSTFADVLAYFSERVRGVEIVQLYAEESAAVASFERRVLAYRATTLRSNVWDALLFATVDGVSAATMALILGYGAAPWMEGVATAGLLAAFVDGVGKLFGPIRELSNKLAILQRAAASVDKLSAVLATTERVADGTESPAGPPGEVVFDGVSFGYEAGNDVVHGVSFTVPPGGVVALVGRTGSGKSTLGKLLTASYGGYRGEIRLDGVELRAWRHDALRRRVGVVPQDGALFPDTVRYNLTLGASIPDERLERAVAQAQATELVARLGGLDGRIDHGGRNLSVGEAQLLAIARVFCRDAPFVVLDEATASVDSVTERRIRDATRSLMAERTVLVVAHRLSTIREAGTIVLLDAGRVVERGSHDALVAAGGAYARLVGEATSGAEAGDAERGADSVAAKG